MESLDRAFQNVCELDLVFRFDEVRLSIAVISIYGLSIDLRRTRGSGPATATLLRRSFDGP